MMKVGIDVEEISRFENIDIEKFCKKYFTETETAYLKNKKIESVAGIYSCKEAILKAIGIGIGKGVNLNEISINHDQNGKPFVENNSTLQKLKKEYNFSYIDISISHTKTIVNTICILG